MRKWQQTLLGANGSVQWSIIQRCIQPTVDQNSVFSANSIFLAIVASVLLGALASSVDAFPLVAVHLCTEVWTYLASFSAESVHTLALPSGTRTTVGAKSLILHILAEINFTSRTGKSFETITLAIFARASITASHVAAGIIWTTINVGSFRTHYAAILALGFGTIGTHDVSTAAGPCANLENPIRICNAKAVEIVTFLTAILANHPAVAIASTTFNALLTDGVWALAPIAVLESGGVDSGRAFGGIARPCVTAAVCCCAIHRER